MKTGILVIAVVLASISLVGLLTEVITFQIRSFDIEKAKEDSVNYNALCVIGRKYTICGPKSRNPFEKQAIATVIILDKKDGFVQYCWDYDYKNPSKTTFSRSCEGFVKQTKLCN